MNTSERAEVTPQSEIFCDLCGYSRQGIPRDARCPECGELPTLIPVESLLEQYRSAGELYWLRSVAVGLGLLLAASGVCLAVALVMPVYAFSLAAVSFVGPKIGAVALIERSLGSAPGPWGVAGVMGVLAQLAGVWLLTERRSVRGNEESFWTLRRIARWTAVICVGAAVGRLLGFDSNGIGDDGAVRGKLYFCLIVGELPANLLLYLHLHQLARRLDVRRAVGALGFCSWAVPVVIAGAVVLLFLQQYLFAPPYGPWTTISVAYGIGSVVVGMVAIMAVGRLFLTASYAGIGPWLSGAKRHERGIAEMLRDGAKAVLLDPGRWCVVGGIVLWLCAWWLQLHAILWRPLREGLFGSMYMINFPGPKVFATPPFLYAYYYYSGGDAAISQLEATALGLMSIWLVTASVVDRRISGRLRNWTRWVATIAVAAPIGATMGMEGLLSRSPTVCHAFIVIFCEVPATVLLYIYLARVAAVFGGPAKTLARVGVAVPFVAGIPMVALVFAVKLAKWRMWPGTALLAGADAVLAVSVAIVAWSAVSRLGLKLAFGGEKREPVADAGT